MKLKSNIILSVILLIPFVINIFGKNTYLYINVGEKDLIFASATGLLHCAYADKMDFMEEENSFVESIGYSNTKIIKSEAINLFMEPSDSMEPFNFRLINSDDYAGIELPWLLLWIIPTFIAIQTMKTKSTDKREQEDQPNSETSLRS